MAPMTIRLTVLVLGVVVLAAPGVSAQANWPQFRGESAGVVADDPTLPETWGPDANIVWTLEVPGRSWSSPIVWGDQVFVLTVMPAAGADEPLQPLRPVENYRARSLGGSMTAANTLTVTTPVRWVLYAVDFESGAVQWEHELHTTVPSLPTHQKSTFASETPVTDGERVYVYLGDIGLFAVNVDGTAAWSVPMEWVPRRDWGAAASPVLHDGRLYMVNDNEAQSFVAAYDAATGDEIWRTNRDERSNWATPFVWENDARTEIVTSGTGGVRSYGLDGELLWQLTGMSTLVIPTPFAAHGLLYINSGYVAAQSRPVYTIRPGASGDITLGEGSTSNDYIVWSHPQLGSYNPSSLVYGELPLHAARPGHPALLRHENGARGLSAGAHHGGHPVYRLAVGIQWQDLRAERGRRHVRHPGRTGIRGARAEFALRDDSGHPRGGERQHHLAHGVEAVSHRDTRRDAMRVGGVRTPRTSPSRGSDPEGGWHHHSRPGFHGLKPSQGGIVTRHKTRVFLFNTFLPSPANMG